MLVDAEALWLGAMSYDVLLQMFLLAQCGRCSVVAFHVLGIGHMFKGLSRRTELTDEKRREVKRNQNWETAGKQTSCWSLFFNLTDEHLCSCHSQLLTHGIW
jgi:hypothetical protein